MKKIQELYKLNKLGPVGLAGALLAIAGVVFPWKITAAGYPNGTTEALGLVLILLAVCYTLILYTNFRWNLLIGAAVFVIGCYKYFAVRAEARGGETGVIGPGLGLTLVIIAGLLMIIGTLLLFRKKKEKN